MRIAVPITTTDPTVQTPQYQTEGAAGFDLATAQEYQIAPKDFVQVSTGVIIRTPPGHMLMLAARSSLYKNYGLILTNSIGIVDEDYSGEGDVIQLSLKNDRQTYVDIPKGTRIAQGVFMPITRATFVPSSAGKITRGGWGSTGYKTQVFDEGGKLIGEQG